MNTIIKFLQQIYALLAQVQEIAKANNQFAQSIEARVIVLEESMKFDAAEIPCAVADDKTADDKIPTV